MRERRGRRRATSDLCSGPGKLTQALGDRAGAQRKLADRTADRGASSRAPGAAPRVVRGRANRHHQGRRAAVALLRRRQPRTSRARWPAAMRRERGRPSCARGLRAAPDCRRRCRSVRRRGGARAPASGSGAGAGAGSGACCGASGAGAGLGRCPRSGASAGPPSRASTARPVGHAADGVTGAAGHRRCRASSSSSAVLPPSAGSRSRTESTAQRS